MKAVILRCSEGAKFHLGEYTEDQRTTLFNTSNIIHSDVLFGAFISALAQIDETQIEEYKGYFKKGKLAISSAFYLVEHKQTNKKIYFLPKPAIFNLFQAKDLDKFDIKKFKKVEFISKGVWESGISPDDWFSDNSECVMPNKYAVRLREEEELDNVAFNFFTHTDEDKVKINPDDDNEPYTISSIELLGDKELSVHFYFLLHCDLDKDKEAFVMKVWDLVASNGLGGERSTGYGEIASVEVEPFNIQVDSKRKVLLGLGFPEDLKHYEYYQTKTRGGMRFGEDESKARLDIITAVTEGAVLKSESVEPRVIDLSKNGKKYWKYSSSVVLPLHRNFNFD